MRTETASDGEDPFAPHARDAMRCAGEKETARRAELRGWMDGWMAGGMDGQGRPLQHDRPRTIKSRSRQETHMQQHPHRTTRKFAACETHRRAPTNHRM